MGKAQKAVKFEERDGVLGKECTKCNMWQSLENFTKQVNCLGGVKSICKLCEKSYRDSRKEERAKLFSDWYSGHKEERKAYRIEYREKNREAYLAGMRNWRIKNPDKCVEQRKKWYAANQEKSFLSKQRRNARKNSLRDDLTQDQLQEIYTFFDGACALTGSTEETQMDHAIPLSIGHGGTFLGNVYPLTSFLNQSKHNYNIFEWFDSNRQRFDLTQERFDILIQWLASANGLTVEEYRDYVYWCHENPHSLDDLREIDEGEAI